MGFHVSIVLLFSDSVFEFMVMFNLSVCKYFLAYFVAIRFFFFRVEGCIGMVVVCFVGVGMGVVLGARGLGS